MFSHLGIPFAIIDGVPFDAILATLIFQRHKVCSAALRSKLLMELIEPHRLFLHERDGGSPPGVSLILINYYGIKIPLNRITQPVARLVVVTLCLPMPHTDFVLDTVS